MVPRIHHGMPNAAPRRQRSRKTARDHHHIVFANRHNVKCTLRSRSLNGMGSDDEGGARSGRLVYKIGPDVHPILGQVLDGRGWRSVSGDDDGSWTLNWQHNRFPKSSYMSCAPHQRLNHCQKSSGITKKDALARQLRRMRNTFGKVYDFSPETWILPRERDQLSARFSSNEIWIVKPCASSKGRDIFLATSAQLTESNDLSQMACIVQRYIPNPMLVFGYKCDLRLYVLVKSFQPLKAYLYRRGLARFTTQQYSLDVDTLGNPYCHLTNSSINRFSPSMSDDKGGIGPGCKWTLARFFSNLAERGFNVPRVQRRIRHLVALTLLSVAHEIVPNRNCFELFGFDVLLDCQAKPWLIEVNSSPALAVSCPEDEEVKIPMLNDLVDRLGWRRSSNPATRPNEFDAIFPLEKNDAVSSPPVDIRRDVDSILRDIRRCRASEATSAT